MQTSAELRDLGEWADAFSVAFAKIEAEDGSWPPLRPVKGRLVLDLSHSYTSHFTQLGSTTRGNDVSPCAPTS